MTKLTPPQQFVIDKMKEGFEIAHSSGHDWMQKKIGHGGESFNVNSHTMFALYKRGAFKKVRGLYYGGSVYHLSVKGKKL